MITKNTASNQVLIVCSHFRPSVGGVETRMEQLSLTLSGLGFHVSVLTMAHPNRDSNNLFDQVKIISSPHESFSSDIRQHVGSGHYAACILVQDPLGVIIWSVEDLAIPACSKLIIQPIINEDGFSRWRDNLDFSQRLVRMLQNADAAVAMTLTGPDARFMRDNQIDMSYIPNAVERIEPAGDFRERFGIARHKFLILHVANLYPVKNHIGLIESLAFMPASWQLVMVGNLTGATDYVTQVMEKLAARPEIMFIPGLNREWVAAAMSAADVVLLASHGEGSPITILEAMSHKKPWLARPQCGAVNDHAGGVVCDLAKFTTYLTALQKNPEISKQLGEIGYEHWRSRYTWSAVGAGWNDLIIDGKLNRSFSPLPELIGKTQDIKQQLANSNTNSNLSGSATLLTVIIATHDRPLLLERTLASLAAQTFKDFTTVVISDSDRYIAPYQGLKNLPGPYQYLLHNGKNGPATSRNIGIHLVKSQYAIFLDDDDTLEPNHLETVAAAIHNASNSGPLIYYCGFNIIEEDRKYSPPQFLKRTVIPVDDISRENLFIKNIIPNSCLVYPKSILQSVQFDTELILFEDWDYLLGCLRKAGIAKLPVNSVNIHKSYLAGEENVRRGNVNDEYLIQTTLEIYRRHPAPNEITRQQRITRFAELGVSL